MAFFNKRHQAIYLLLFITMLVQNHVIAQPLTARQIDSITLKAMKAFNVPGMSVAIVKDGKVAYIKGYGVRSVKTGLLVNGNTLFGIASNSQAFTAAALGILVNEGKLKWDDKVTDYIPELRMYDDYATVNLTIRDMLTHRTGLGQNEGDLMHNPDSTNFTVADIIHNLRYLKPATSFRAKYAYDNIMYLVAAEVVKRVSGISWQEFIETRIMQPLKMVNSGATYVRVKHNHDIIDGHFEVNGKLQTFTRSDEEMDAGAGGIYSSAADMSKWMLMQLNNGRFGEGFKDSLFSAAVHKEMWTPQVVIPVRHAGIYDTHFNAYGFGWFLSDTKGYLEVAHSGQDDGMISLIKLLPELNLGITVLSNQEGGGAVVAAVDQLTDGFLGIKGIDHIKLLQDRINKGSMDADTLTRTVWKRVSLNENNNIKPDPGTYTGVFRDNWLGDVTISLQNNGLLFQSARSKQLKGFLHFYKGNTFVIKWVNPKINIDTFISFVLDEQGQASGFKMTAVLENSSPGFDFKDLNFARLSK